jgi:hypothetical protein
MALYKKWLTKTELEAEANQIIDEDFSDTENKTSGSEDEEDVVEVEEENSNDDKNSGEENQATTSHSNHAMNQTTHQSGSGSTSALDTDDESDDNMPLSSIAENLKHIIIPTKSSWKGKNGHRWSTIEPQRKKRVPTRNIIHFVPGSKGLASHMLTPGSCFKHFFSDNMLHNSYKRANRPEIGRL